jgi:hypothetical protein
MVVAAAGPLDMRTPPSMVGLPVGAHTAGNIPT